jgi:hypothetical protein
MTIAPDRRSGYFAWWQRELYYPHKRQRADDLPWLMRDMAIEITDPTAREHLFDLLWKAWRELYDERKTT